MSLDRTFLNAIRRDPQDWNLWGVFGDWLVSQGDPRGELVQRAHVLAQLAPHDPSRMARRSQVDRLEEEARAHLLTELAVPFDVALQWMNGFILGVSSRAGVGETLDFLNTLRDHPGGPVLSWLSFNRARLDPEEVVALASAPGLVGLAYLKLPHLHIDARGAGALAGSQVLEELISLDLSHNPLGPAGARAFGQAEGLRCLTHLNLQATTLKSGGSLLCDAPWFRQLKEIRLGDNQLTAKEAGVLAQAVGPELTVLDLGQNQLGDAGAQALAETVWPGLQSLSLAANNLGAAGLSALVERPQFPNLTSLNLYDNPVGDSGVRTLAASPHLSRLRTLHLAAANITSAGAQPLANSPHFPELQTLNLWGNQVDDEGALAFTNGPRHALATLDLRNNPLTRQGEDRLRAEASFSVHVPSGRQR